MFLLNEKTELTPDLICKILSVYQTRDLPKLNKFYDYYIGKHPILMKKPSDEGKPCNKLVVNFCKNIVDTFLGYITGIDIQYHSDDEMFQEIDDILNYNDCHTEDSELLRDALIFGKSCELNYIDSNGEQRFKVLDIRNVIPVYDDTVEQNLLYAIRFYKADYIDNESNSYYVEVYDRQNMAKYRSTCGFTSLQLIDVENHMFEDVPLTFFSLNKEEESIYAQILTLQDAYNTIASAGVDDYEGLVDALLLIKGAYGDDEDLAKMKRNRVLMLDADCDAEFLTKNVSDTQAVNGLENIDDKIHLIALYPDFNDERFMAQSGIAMRYKLIGFENASSAIVANMKKALQRRLELICGVINMINGDRVWRDVEIIFTRNLPENLDETASAINAFRGLVSNETLLAQIPFIDNPQEEMERVQKENEQRAQMYANSLSFGLEEETEDEE